MAAEAISAILASADFFARLGLPRQTTAPADVRRSYRRRALQCHPDKSDHPRANEAFQQLSEAFECLHDERAQAMYLHTARQQEGSEHRVHKRRRSDASGGSKRRRADGSTAGATWYQRARSWADIERELARREEAERVIRARFIASQSSKFNCREAERLLLRAQKICRTLDERKTGTKINPLWATLVEQEVAAAAISEDVPEGWETRRSRDGLLYYFHARTGQSSSDHPDPVRRAEKPEQTAANTAAAPPSNGLGRGDAREQLTEIIEYLHKEHAFYDLDDEVEELNEMISDRQFTKADVHQASSGSHSVRPAGGLGQGEYDY